MRSLTEAIKSVIAPQADIQEAKKKIGEYSQLMKESEEDTSMPCKCHNDKTLRGMSQEDLIAHHKHVSKFADDQSDDPTIRKTLKSHLSRVEDFIDDDNQEKLHEDWASITDPSKVFGKKDSPKKTYGKEYDAEQDDVRSDDGSSTKHDTSALADVLGLKPKTAAPLSAKERKSMTPAQIRARLAAQGNEPTPRVHRMQDDLGEGLDEAKGADGRYHPNNPKIDLYHNGNYVASTNWSSTVKHAVATAKAKYPDMTGEWKGHKSIKESMELDEAVISEAYKKSEHAAAHDAFLNLDENHPARIAYENASPAEQKKLRAHHIYVNRMITSGGDPKKIEARKVKFYNHINKLHGYKPVKANTKLGEEVELQESYVGLFEDQEMIEEMALSATKISTGKFKIKWRGSKGIPSGEYMSDYHPTHENFSPYTMKKLDEGIVSALKDTLTPQKGETWKDVAKDMVGFKPSDVVDGAKTIGKVAKKTLKMLKNPVKTADQRYSNK